MAKLSLSFEHSLLKEYELKNGSSITIGRLPDNTVHIDNLAVSGHHARIIWENDHFVIEDNNSLNGTFINNQRIQRSPLKDGDVILIGKHTLSFEGFGHYSSNVVLYASSASGPAVPAMESTMVLDTKRAKDMIAQAAGGPGAAAAPAKEVTGVLTVTSGKTDHPQYTLTSKLTVIGKSDMASIKLKGWLAPRVAAVINKRDSKYLIAASEKSVKVKVNEKEITGQHQLADGDTVEVAGVKLSFTLAE